MIDTPKIEKIRLLYGQTAGVVLGSTFVAIATCYILWPETSHTPLLIWLGASILLGYTRACTQRLFRHRIENKVAATLNYQYWGALYILCSLGAGIIWGLTLILFFPQNSQTLATILVFHAGYCSAAMLAAAVYLPAFCSFIISSSAMMIGGILYNGGSNFWFISIVIAFYTAMSLYFAVRNNISFTNQITLRLQNSKLISDLKSQVQQEQNNVLRKNQFLAAASHNIRQPLQSIELFANAAKSHAKDPEAQQLLAKIEQAKNELSQSLQNLLDISRLDAARVPMAPTKIYLDNLLVRLFEKFEPMATSKRLALSIPQNTQFALSTDAESLENVLQKLINNAIEYTSQGEVTITVELDQSTGTLKIAIIDTGIGFSSQEQQQILSEYRIIDTPTRYKTTDNATPTQNIGKRSTGFSLAVVKRLCILLNISLQIDSTPGRGSTFTLLLPKAECITPTDFEAPEKIEIPKDKPVVLAIDDEVSILEGMQYLLGSWGCFIITGTSIETALENAADAERIDLIIADYGLTNDETGLEAISAIREYHEADIPALLITGAKSTLVERQAAEAEVQVILKPVDSAKLRDTIEAIAVPEQA